MVVAVVASATLWICVAVVGLVLAYVLADVLRYWVAKPVTDVLDEILTEIKKRDPPA